MTKALACVTLLAVVAVASAQYVPWDDSFFFPNATATTVPVCGGSISNNCYEQTYGQGKATITGYRVTSSVFPCTSGKTATVLDWEINGVTIEKGNCDVTCDGFGCNNGNVEVCKDFGFNCPQGSGSVSTTGPSGDCKSGLGDYVVTINCKHFGFTTYIGY